MPETAPDERKAMMEAMGATVVKVPGETMLTLTLNPNPNPNPSPSPNPNPTPTPNPSPNQVPGETLLSAVAECIAAERRVLLHPFDDLELIRGHASCGLEILEDAPTADLIVVCCCGDSPLAHP